MLVLIPVLVLVLVPVLVLVLNAQNPESTRSLAPPSRQSIPNGHGLHATPETTPSCLYPRCRLYKCPAHGRQVAVPVDSSMGGCSGRFSQANAWTEDESLGGFLSWPQSGLVKLGMWVVGSTVTCVQSITQSSNACGYNVKL